MAEGNWVKPGTEPWPSPGEQYPGSGGGGMEAGSGENGRNMGYMGTSRNFLLCSAPPPSLTSARLSFPKLSGGFHESFENL